MRPHSDPWARLATDFLRYWRQRAVTLYLEDIKSIRITKKGEVHASDRAAITIGAQQIKALTRELKQRGAL